MTADGHGSGRPSGRPSGGAMARLLVLGALLAGLFLMHGSPTSAGGCHEPGAAAVAMAAAGPHHDAPALDGHRARGSDPQAVSCVSTRDRDGAGLPAAAPLAAGAFAPLLAVRVAADPRGRRTGGPRAPPAAGRRLLLRVCVART
ncbi:hypothetical protein [Kitasatospora sp. NPDC088548]|uniref:hypothetical protein n=1 Tax=Kitasatospora sp. NPDC088548 TaxID=3364075 RepID=UPI003817102A